MAPDTVVLGITACREVSAFYLSELAKAVGLGVDAFVAAVKESDEILCNATSQADPIERMEAERGGSEEGCFYSLGLIYPGAIRERELLS